MRTLFLVILILHGLIHVMGFVKAFGIAEIGELALPVTRGWGLLSLTAALTLITAGILWILNMENWWMAALIGVILSQMLIFVFWQDARFGTISNVIIFIVMIVLLNPAFDGTLDPLPEPAGNTVIFGDTRYNLVQNNNAHEISSLSRTHNGHTVTMAFSPAFSNLGVFTGRAAKGVFEFSGHESAGAVRGEYTVENNDGQIRVELNPSGGWIPNEKKLSVRFLYRVVPMFRNWPTTYRWTAYLNKDENGVLKMNSSWERKNMEGHHPNN